MKSNWHEKIIDLPIWSCFLNIIIRMYT